MELGELRHFDRIQENFRVSETEYVASATLDKEKLEYQYLLTAT
jgi:hypothetical protein